MDILAALKQEEVKWEKQAEEARQQLETVRAAIKLFRGETGKRTSTLGSSSKTTGGKKRVMSAAARARISKASKERWAKFRAAKVKRKQ
jgi:hypothetical protein